MIVSCDVGLTCDIIDESFYKPIVVAPTNPSCSTTTTISPLSDGFTCDASLMVEISSWFYHIKIYSVDFLFKEN